MCCCGVAMDLRNRGRKGWERDFNESKLFQGEEKDDRSCSGLERDRGQEDSFFFFFLSLFCCVRV